MTANKIIKSFIIIFAVLALVILLLLIFSYLSYSINKQRNIVNQSNPQNIEIEESVKEVDVIKAKEYSNIELKKIFNPEKTDEELVELETARESLPNKIYTEEEIRSEFGL